MLAILNPIVIYPIQKLMLIIDLIYELGYELHIINLNVIIQVSITKLLLVLLKYNISIGIILFI